ncbi:TRAP transporter small permease subunit [Vibrio sp. F74]|uniref:TRAP transporter small permease subunit n=1 Tax=Vibrio sp. F74 TaxID=700020 RepID=UPI0035F57ADC
MNVINRVMERLTFVMHMISGTTLICMMFVTLFDVLSRSLFEATNGSVDITFIGGVELIKYGLLIVVLFALPHSLGRSQVIVDLFTDTLKTRTKATLEGFYILGFVLLGSGMSYRFYCAIEEAEMSGETTQDLLIPLGYLYGISSFATAVLAITALLSSLNLFIHGREELPR